MILKFFFDTLSDRHAYFVANQSIGFAVSVSWGNALICKNMDHDEIQSMKQTTLRHFTALGGCPGVGECPGILVCMPM